MMHRAVLALLSLGLLASCSVESALRRNEDRYAQPGALDTPLTGAYSVYSFKLLGRYRVTYEWVTTTGCGFRGYALPPTPGPSRNTIYVVPDVFEDGGKTWQASNFGKPPMDLDPWVTSVKIASRSKGEEGQLVEIGMKTLCQESWWASSHFLFIRLRRASVDAVQEEVTAASTGVPIQWTRRMRNGIEWRVLEVPLDQLRPRRPNATGAPYQTWIAPLGDTGYSIAFSLGASKESMAYPRAHAAFEATFQHLLDSLRVEPLPR